MNLYQNGTDPVRRFEEAAEQLGKRAPLLHRVPTEIKKEVQEIRFRTNRPITLCTGNRTWFLTDSGALLPQASSQCPLVGAGEMQELFRSCWQIRLANAHMYRGRIHPCIRSLFGQDLGLIPVPPGDYVDVRDLSQSREEKREILARFGQLPPLACQYCGGFDSLRAERFPAAEQAAL